jgi:hypothetical protein
MSLLLAQSRQANSCPEWSLLDKQRTLVGPAAIDPTATSPATTAFQSSSWEMI